jgi:hypothetical protein
LGVIDRKLISVMVARNNTSGGAARVITQVCAYVWVHTRARGHRRVTPTLPVFACPLPIKRQTHMTETQQRRAYSRFP